MGYTEKEIAIFNGVIKLIKSGIDPYLIKVQEIAAAANVGKGTIYEYFRTKEEAISKAILYNLRHEIEAAFTRIKEKKIFKAKFDTLLDIVREFFDNNSSTLNLLLSAGGIQEFYSYLSNEQFDLQEIAANVKNVIEHLLQCGYQEGVFTLQENPYYQQMAVHGAISGFVQYLSQRELYLHITLEEAKRVAYKLLLKALN
ncbi:MAG: TetR/AcrR family transcriptional regulator [Firmicutes bacterium]|nr:TetR/AcrR family transcriptional regulator [Bacillota bacterium]